jgi:hypothetical protein
VVDWQVKNGDVNDARRQYPPRTLGSVVRRVAGWMLWDLKGWLIAVHPGREYRADWKPEALEPCVACGHSALWPRWFVEGREGPGGSLNAQERPLATDHWPLTTEDVPATYRFPLDFQGNAELEPVKEFDQSPAGQLIARITAGSRDECTMRLFADDDLMPSGGLSLQEAQPASSDIAHLENSHDADAQATQNPHCHPGLPGTQRVFANHAGTGGSARRVKGHNLRTRRGARKEGTHPASPEQGSLFGSLADGEAA